jgi:hypothetical protein
MHRGRWAGIAASFAIAAVAAVSAGCGGGSSLALDPVAAAATKTEHAGAAHIRFALSFTGPHTRGHKVKLTGLGVIEGTSSELTVGLGSLAAQSFGPAVNANASLKEISLEQNGDYLLFLNGGFLTAHLPGGKHWVELDISKLGKAAGLDLGGLMSASQLQPSDILSMLKAEAAATVRNLGTATVDGVATTHYRITVDLAKALKESGLAKPILSRVAAKAGKVPADVWVDKDGLVRRIRISLGSPNTRRHLSLTMDVSDYGADVTIAAPPSSDVFDATQLAQLGIGSAFSPRS